MFDNMQLEQLEAISNLAEICSKMSKQDNIWAGKMLRAWDITPKLSPKQYNIVKDLLARNQQLVDQLYS